MMNRRYLLALLGTSALTACAGQTPAQTFATAVADASDIFNGLTGYLPALGQIPNIDPATVAKVGSYVSQAKGYIDALKAAATSPEAQSNAQQIVQILMQIAQVAGPSLPPPWGLAIQAALTIAPIFLRHVGLNPPAAAPMAGAVPMDEARARLILRGAPGAK